MNILKRLKLFGAHPVLIYYFNASNVLLFPFPDKSGSKLIYNSGGNVKEINTLSDLIKREIYDEIN